MNKSILSFAFILLALINFAQKKGTDSLAGFDYLGAAEHASHMNTDKEKFQFLEHAKRTYKISKFDLYKNPISSNKGPGNTIQQGPQPAGCTNIDFEGGNTAGWTVSGDNQIQTTAMGNDPFGGFPKVRPGGNFSLRLNDNNIAGKTTFTAQASRVIPVSPSNNQFQLHFAFCLLNFPHPGNAAALFQVQFFNSANQQLTCPTFSCYYANPPGQFFGMPPGTAQTSAVNGVNIGNQSYPVTYVPWQTVAMDLSPYNGQNITVKITCNWCIYNYDWGYCYIDADCASNNFNPSNNPCGPLPQQLCGPAGMQSYTWTPPPGGGAVQTTSCVSGTAAGIYTLNCTPFTACAAVQNYTFALGGAPPTANFIFSPACINSAASFTSTSVGATTYTWNWGDGSPVTTGTNVNQSHTYTSGGPKQVTLWAANSAGCKDSITIQVTPVPSPVAAFNFTPGCVNQNAYFHDNTNLNGGPALSNWDWNWNDATPNGTLQNMSHIYTNNGTQTVTLIVTNSSGCKDTVTQTLVANPSPIVNFSFNTVCEGAPITFNNTTNVNGSNIANWLWDFNGDFVTDNTTQSPTYTFPASGVFNVNLIAVTDLGCSDSIQQIVNVYSKPIAQFGTTKTCLGDYTALADNSYVIGTNGAITNWEWDTDNNMSSIETTGQNAMALFTTHGPKTIHLIVTTNHGCKDTATLSMYVNPSPVVDFSADKLSGCEKLNVNFNNATIIPAGTIATYSWTLGDHTVTMDQSPSHSYPAGIYTITLLAISDSGCVGTKTINNYIHSYPVPQADFYANPQSADVLEPLVNFNNTTYGAYNKWWWYFGDGSLVDTIHKHPTHTYSDEFATTYVTTLIVQNQYGCSDTIQKMVVIDPNYVIYVPNAFTPNGDGLNDVFQPKGYYIKKFEMDIFDRWGERIFSTKDIAQGWDGTVKGKNVENSVYVWKAIVIDIQNKRHELTGHVTLIK